MTQRNIPVAETFAKWRADHEYVAAYEKLEEEFARAAALIRERGHGGTTRETELATRR
jgi:hypothetical protein